LIIREVNELIYLSQVEVIGIIIRLVDRVLLNKKESDSVSGRFLSEKSLMGWMVLGKTLMSKS